MQRRNHSPIAQAGLWLAFGLLALIMALPLTAHRFGWVAEDVLFTLPEGAQTFIMAHRDENIKPSALWEELSSLRPSPGLLRTVSKNTQGRPGFSAAAAKYDSMIQRAAQKHSVSPLLVKAVIQAESNFNPAAVSNNGAVGLMQLLPSTARSMGFHDPLDPQNNIMAGTRYLKTLLNLYDDDEALAVAAYNAGPDKLRQFGGRVPPYRETRAFVERVMALYHSNLDI